MTRISTLLALILGSTIALPAHSQPAPQTARQALLEMFFSKTPGTLEKHLPEATRAALHKSGAGSGTSMLDGFSLLTSQLQSRGQALQTFAAGPTLLVIIDPQAHNKFEVTVERDDLRGEEDDIELSFHGYKDGQPQTAGANFRFTFTMKQEKSVWRLNEITLAIGVSLTDPEFLKAMTRGIKPPTTSLSNNQGSIANNSVLVGIRAANEAAAEGSVRTINTAEVTYAAAYPEHGFTCFLSDLGGMAGGEPNERQAMIIDPRLASGRKSGYILRLSGCDGTPASKYSLTAAPADPASGTRAFCSDESGVVRFSPDGDAAACLSTGQPLH